MSVVDHLCMLLRIANPFRPIEFEVLAGRIDPRESWYAVERKLPLQVEESLF
jgi:hypothetical protein